MLFSQANNEFNLVTLIKIEKNSYLILTNIQRLCILNNSSFRKEWSKNADNRVLISKHSLVKLVY